MTLFFHELKRGRVALFVWTAALGFMLAITVFIYPQMAQQMDEVTKAFSEMGAFSTAFGMDKLNFGELTDYFCVECGNTIGLGGAIFAAILGCAALAKEEREHTAEFLCAHPVSRLEIALQKLAAVYVQIIFLNAAVATVTALSILAIGESADARVVSLTFIAMLLLQLEIASVTFAVSAFAVRGGTGIGIGIAFGFYFLNILSNITEDLKFLKNITPYAMAEGATIREDGLVVKYVLIAAGVSVLSVLIALIRYRKKDL